MSRSSHLCNEGVFGALILRRAVLPSGFHDPVKMASYSTRDTVLETLLNRDWMYDMRLTEARHNTGSLNR